MVIVILVISEFETVSRLLMELSILNKIHIIADYFVNVDVRKAVVVSCQGHYVETSLHIWPKTGKETRSLYAYESCCFVLLELLVHCGAALIHDNLCLLS